VAIGAPGNRLVVKWNRLKIGFRGARHESGTGMTVKRLATIQHFGKGRVPKREILTEPSERAKNTMRNSLERGFKAYLERTIGGKK